MISPIVFFKFVRKRDFMTHSMSIDGLTQNSFSRSTSTRPTKMTFDANLYKTATERVFHAISMTASNVEEQKIDTCMEQLKASITPVTANLLRRSASYSCRDHPVCTRVFDNNGEFQRPQ